MKDTNYLIECVPNISEGRDDDKIKSIINSITSTKVHLLHVDTGYDANRTVITLVGKVDDMMVAIECLYRAAAKHIDMKNQHGAHPRLGAVDICPFIPFDWKNKNDLARKVQGLAKRISAEFKFPVFLYADSSIGQAKKTLPEIRKGEYELLTSNPTELAYEADFGAKYINTAFGGSVMGVRDFMLAYNVNLSTQDLSLAKKIAKKMRKARSEKGAFKDKNIRPLQILAWKMDKYNCCQISTNIHNPRSLSLVSVFNFVREVSQSMGVKAESSELIGMIPAFAVDLAREELSKIESHKPLIKYLGLDFNGTFDWEKNIIPTAFIKF